MKNSCCWSSKEKKYEYKCVVDFDNGKGTHLKISKGDVIIISNIESNKEWVNGKNKSTGKKGLVPRSFLIEPVFSMEHTEGFFILNRKEATLKLLLPGVDVGTYIIRPSQDGKRLAISIRLKNSISEHDVGHFIIKTDEKNQLYIRPNIVFKTLKGLIDYFSGNTELDIQLRQPYAVHYSLPPLDECNIPFENLEFKGTIGKGAFGEVFLGMWNKKIEVAIKKLDSSAMSLRNIIREATIIQSMRNKFILQLIGISKNKLDGSMHIITEYLHNGNVSVFLRKDTKKDMKTDHLVDMIYQVAQGMEYLSDKKVVHRDLRADNILVADDLSIRISDFGLALLVSDEAYKEKSIITMFPIRWSAPESIKSEIFNEQTDIWSYGVTSFEVMSRGLFPFKDITNPEVRSLVLAGHTMESQINFTCPPLIKLLMLRCWKYNSTERPTFKEIVDELRTIYFANDHEQ